MILKKRMLKADADKKIEEKNEAQIETGRIWIYILERKQKK